MSIIEGMTSQSKDADKKKEAVDNTTSKVISAFGEITREEFKTRYASLFSYIDSGEYLLLKKKQFTIQFGKLVVMMCPLSKSDNDFLDTLIEVDDNGRVMPSSWAFRNFIRLVISLIKLQEVTFEVIPPPTGKEWLELPAVKKKLEALKSLEDAVVTKLIEISIDMREATMMALMDSVLSPTLAPEPSTATE